MMEAEIWRDLHTRSQERLSSSVTRNIISPVWVKPLQGWVKCNIASSWVASSNNSGGASIVRNDVGSVVFHSRRSFSRSDTPLMASLSSLLWSVEAMASLRLDKIMFETSSDVLKYAFIKRSSIPQVERMVSAILQRLDTFQDWRLNHVVNEENKVATLVATSVTADSRFQSYVATGGPSWLQDLLAREAARTLP